MALSRPVPMAPHPGPLAHPLKGTECRELLAFWGPQPSSYIEPRGRRRGYWHAMLSMDRPTGAWLAFLPEWAKERVALSQ